MDELSLIEILVSIIALLIVSLAGINGVSLANYHGVYQRHRDKVYILETEVSPYGEVIERLKVKKRVYKVNSDVDSQACILGDMVDFKLNQGM